MLDILEQLGWPLTSAGLDPADVHPLRRPFIWRCEWLHPTLIAQLRARGYSYWGTYRAPKGHVLGQGAPIHIVSLTRARPRLFVEYRMRVILDIIRRPTA